MARKTLICTLAILMFSLFSGICFAADSGNSINLGNEIMQSIDKTENSMRNVVSGNVVRDAGNMVKDGANTVGNGINNMGDTVNNRNNEINNDMNNNNNYNMNNRDNGRDYNTVRTTAEGTTTTTTNTMTTTTWMWIILALAATIIFVAIWYYATQDNS